MQIEIDNFNIEYQKYGTGNMPVLLLHGWGGNSNSLMCFASSLSGEDYSFYALTLCPEYNNTSLTMFNYFNIVKQFIEMQNIYGCIVICHSFGARIAFMLAGKLYNHVSRLIVIAGAGIKPKFNLKAYLKIKHYKWLKKHNKLKQKDYGSADYNMLTKKGKQTLVNVVNFDIEKYTFYIKIPVLLLYGSKDTITPLYMAKKLHKNIKTSKLVVLKGCNHFCYQQDLTTCLKYITEFLE